MSETTPRTAEHERLHQDQQRLKNWKRWGPYLSERQWGTVREDYSAKGDAWHSFPHDQARSRAYRWGEDGLLGISDRQCRLCFGIALWNHQDAILKERLYGLTGPQGNHGEDVKELYYYLDSTPTHSWMKALYKYPQRAFPYVELIRENASRGLEEREYEITDTEAFSDSRYFDVAAEYAKAGPEDVLIRIRITNRGPEEAPLDVLPTVWFRNTWSWNEQPIRPQMKLSEGRVSLAHEELGPYVFEADGESIEWLFTENDTDHERLFDLPNDQPFTKNAFHRHVVDQETGAVNPEEVGTKAAARYSLVIPAGQEVVLRLRLRKTPTSSEPSFGSEFDALFQSRQEEADDFYGHLLCSDPEAAKIQRQAYAGLLWTKQFYHYVVESWLRGDPASPPPPEERRLGRNRHWQHLFARDILSMPDKWEYPWFAAWDTAFHMLPFAEVDPDFAKNQMLLFLREWYLHPNGQIPAYEWKFNDVNPPVHAWACWRIYKITAPGGERDREFLERCFQKLMLNFTWWVNRKDSEGRNLFAGGFLGLDNIGIFDRSKPLPEGQRLEQADATAWMAFYALTMLNMALELAKQPDGSINTAYEDMASKFFEHFIQIVDAINTLGGEGLWDEEDGFYYDQIVEDNQPPVRLRTRSLVGLLPLIAVELLDEERIAELPGFQKRMDWFMRHRCDLAENASYCEVGGIGGLRLLAIPSKERLVRLVQYLLDEEEFLSPFGIRSLSKYHAEHPFTLQLDGGTHQVSYVPGESDSHMFGGNSNWRGPIWFPTSYLIIESLERYHRYYGDSLQVEFPARSGQTISLLEAARELARRQCRLFEPDDAGRRPAHGGDERYAQDPAFKDLILFYEYFDPDTGRGCGASHQTGWTALVARLLRKHRS